jgi:6-phosphogluconolactonase
MTRIEVAESVDALSHTVAEQFVRLTTDVIRERGRCTVALSGGSTPKAVYRALAAEPFRSRVLWEWIHFFWGDERHVPPDHVDSNYRMAMEALLSCVPVTDAQIHRIHSERADAERAAQQYDDEVRAFFGNDVPRFDLVHLGLGKDGHTASLFPGTQALDERKRFCVANWVPSLSAHRLTLTLPVFNAARVVSFIVSGVEKAPIVAQALRGLRETDASPLPAGLLQPVDGELWWMLDRAAAGELS